MKNKRGIVIFTGYNTRAIVAFCRFLRTRGLQAHLIARDQQDPIFLTSYCEWVRFTRKSQNLTFEQCLDFFRTIKSEASYQSLFVAPTSEYLNRFLLNYLVKLEEERVHVPLVDSTFYKKISDKYPFRCMCIEHGLDVPHLIDRDNISFPCVAKKYSYEAGSINHPKPYLIFTESDYEDFASSEVLNDFYYEEYIQGESYYLLLHLSRLGKVTSTSQQNIIQQADGKSIVAARPSDLHLQKVAQQYCELLVSLGFHGLVMIELRKKLDTYLLIEANPRFWGPMQFVVDNYPILIDEYLNDNGISCEIQQEGKVDCFKPRSYFWYGGLVSDEKLCKNTSYYQYSPSMLEDNLDLWLDSDVFLRSDTIRLFHAEIEGTVKT